MALSKIPDGWGINRLADICSHTNGVWGIPDQYGIPVLRSTDFVGDGTLNYHTAIRINLSDREISKAQLTEGDILLERSGGGPNKPVGRVAYFSEKGIFCFGNFITRLRVSLDFIFPRYLFYFLHFFHISGGTEKLQTQTTNIRNLRFREYLNISIPLPYPDDPARSLAEQRRIVARLEALLGEVKAMREQVQTMQRDVNHLMESALAEVFRSTDNFLSTPIFKIADVKGGKRLPKGETFAEKVTSFPYIRVTDFQDYSVNLSNLRYLKPETYQKIKRYTISKEDIYISIAGTIGLVGTIPQKLDGANLTENAAKIVIKPEYRSNIEKKYLVYYLSSLSGKKQIEDRTKVVGQPKLALERIKTIEVPIPYPNDPSHSLSEQRRIVAYLDGIQAEVREAQKLLEVDLCAIEQLEQSILAAAFRGEI